MSKLQELQKLAHELRSKASEIQNAQKNKAEALASIRAAENMINAAYRHDPGEVKDLEEYISDLEAKIKQYDAIIARGHDAEKRLADVKKQIHDIESANAAQQNADGRARLEYAMAILESRIENRENIIDTDGYSADVYEQTQQELNSLNAEHERLATELTILNHRSNFSK